MYTILLKQGIKSVKFGSFSNS